MLTFSWIGGINPFDFIKCPVCEGREYTSLSGSEVWCDRCNCRFRVRNTAGDPGCVVDAFNDDCWMPVYRCTEPDCKGEVVPFTHFDEPDECPVNPEHRMSKSLSYRSPLEKFSWYIILKTGEYCSGWIRCGMLSTKVDRPKHSDREWWSFLTDGKDAYTGDMVLVDSRLLAEVCEAAGMDVCDKLKTAKPSEKEKE